MHQIFFIKESLLCISTKHLMHTTVHAMHVMEHTARTIRAGMEAPPQEKAHPQMMMAPRNLN